jgi:hypothetical protein
MWSLDSRIVLVLALMFGGMALTPPPGAADETLAVADKPAVEDKPAAEDTPAVEQQLTIQETPAVSEKSKLPWSLTLLGGQYSGSQLLEIPARLALKDSWTIGLSVSKQFAEFTRFMRWEGEFQVVKHIGEQDHWELTGSINLRWVVFPWNRYVETTAAFGGGVSWASEVPALEKADSSNDTTNQWLNYLLLELTAGIPDSHWSLVTRIHHRSGVFGLFGHSGSNVLEAGIRYRF